MVLGRAHQVSTESLPTGNDGSGSEKSVPVCSWNEVQRQLECVEEAAGRQAC